MEPLNADCFHQSHWLVIARGYDVESWFDDNQGVGSGGILDPIAAHLPVGQKYYRFASSTSAMEAQVGGGWWIAYEAFHTIDTYSRQHGINLSDAARLFLALPIEWTRVDRLVTAILAVPLKAYVGYGKPATGNNKSNWTPIQHLPVIQYYIPGLYVRRQSQDQKPYMQAFPVKEEPQLYETAFPTPQFEFIMGNKQRA